MRRYYKCKREIFHFTVGKKYKEVTTIDHMKLSRVALIDDREKISEFDNIEVHKYFELIIK